MSDLKPDGCCSAARRHWERTQREAIGALFDELASDSQRAILGLAHKSLSVRNVALSLLSTHWPADADILRAVEASLSSEKEPVVVANAVVTLALLRHQLFGEKVSAVLAGYIRDPLLDDQARSILYNQLLVAFGDANTQMTILRTSRPVRRTIQDIDNRLVSWCVDNDRVSRHLPSPEDSRRLLAIELFKKARAQLEEGRTDIARSLLKQSCELWQTPLAVDLLRDIGSGE